MKRLLTLMVIGLVVGLFSSYGIAGVNWQCNQAELVSHTLGSPENKYIVTWQCVSDDGKDRELHELTYYGSWNSSTQLASESVHDRFKYWREGEQKNDHTYYYEVTAKCLEDPWISGSPCLANFYSVTPIYPVNEHFPYLAPTPRGASLLSGASRQALQGELAARRSAPEIVEPVKGATYGYPENIPIRIVHQPEYGLRFKVEWRQDSQQAFTPVSNSIIFGLQTSNGVTTGKIHPIKEGEWTIRAQLDTNSDPWWSDPCTFTVATGGDSVLGPPPQGGLRIISPLAGQTVTGNLTIKLMLGGYPQSLLTAPGTRLDWWYSAPVEPGQWPSTPESVEIMPVMQGDQLVVPRSLFTKYGIWRLQATLRISDSLSLVDDVSFKIESKAFQEKLSQPMLEQQTMIIPSWSPTGVQQNHSATRPRPEMRKIAAPPVIVRPTENEQISAPGSIRIQCQVSESKEKLEWEIEYQAFGAGSFTRQPNLHFSSVPMGPRGQLTNVSLNKPGQYRFRVRESGPGAIWSQWRTIVVGTAAEKQPRVTPTIVKPEHKVPETTVKDIHSPDQELPGKTPQKLQRPAPVKPKRITPARPQNILPIK